MGKKRNHFDVSLCEKASLRSPKQSTTKLKQHEYYSNKQGLDGNAEVILRQTKCFSEKHFPEILHQSLGVESEKNIPAGAIRSRT